MTPSPTEGTLLAIDGELPRPETIRSLLDRHTALVAADGAALRLHAAGILPDVVIGDLDTLGEMSETLRSLGVVVIRDPSQETNDFTKALDWIIARGETAVTVLGMGGGMIDHVLNNFSVLTRYASRLRLRTLDDRCVGHVVTDRLTLAARPGDRVSLIPLPHARMTTTGLQWPLTDESLSFGGREGASNRAIADRVVVDVAEGVVAVFHYGGVEC